MIVGAVVLTAVIVGGVFWWTNKQHYESTDNAFVQADTVIVSPQVAGYIAEVLVSDNQHVEAGQVLARIDPSTFEAKLAQAQANAAALDAAVKNVDDKAALEQAMIAQRAAGVDSAKAAASATSADDCRRRRNRPADGRSDIRNPKCEYSGGYREWVPACVCDLSACLSPLSGGHTAGLTAALSRRVDVARPGEAVHAEAADAERDGGQKPPAVGLLEECLQRDVETAGLLGVDGDRCRDEQRSDDAERNALGDEPGLAESDHDAAALASSALVEVVDE
jgi:hypothetical protein